ncbi:MAG: hypothetical protein PWR06_2767 [Thermoanaerobacteraceae bacterium]|nr:hypothetical protein [Thermoanaerobacteraceae bacterium]
MATAIHRRGVQIATPTGPITVIIPSPSNPTAKVYTTLSTGPPISKIIIAPRTRPKNILFPKPRPLSHAVRPAITPEKGVPMTYTINPPTMKVPIIGITIIGITALIFLGTGIFLR